MAHTGAHLGPLPLTHPEMGADLRPCPEVSPLFTLFVAPNQRLPTTPQHDKGHSRVRYSRSVQPDHDHAASHQIDDAGHRGFASNYSVQLCESSSPPSTRQVSNKGCRGSSQWQRQLPTFFQFRGSSSAWIDLRISWSSP